jgi:cell division transport system permease protein
MKKHWQSFKRSWVHQTGTQLATLSVLSATFIVVGFVFCLSLNMKRLLTHWGESVQLTVYLRDDINPDALAKVRHELEGDKRFKTLEYIPKENATELFKTQMASYAPELLTDTEFSNPFPASFQLRVSDKIESGAIAGVLEGVAQHLSSFSGVEEVSYGQSWVNNYSSFVRALSASGSLIVLILLGGSFFVVGNAIRASISSRRDEIEILELVGATQAMIRAPYLFEGAVMGFGSAAIAIAGNYGLYSWELSLLKSSTAFARVATNISFIGIGGALTMLAVGTVVGYCGALLTVRQINDGFSASQRLAND